MRVHSIEFIQFLPDGLVVLFAVLAGEGGVVGQGALDGAGGEGVVGDGAFDGAALLVFDIVPADGFVLLFVSVAGETDAGEAFAGGEDDAALLVIPSVGFVLAHNGELHPVDGLQFFEGEFEFAGDEDVEFDQGPAAGEVAAEGTIAGPLGSEVFPKIRVQARVVTEPVLGCEVAFPALFPKVSVVGGEAVESECAR